MMTRKVSTSSIKPSLLWFRRLAVALVLLFAAQAGWGQTSYIWTGNAGDGSWGNAENWNPNSGVPGAGDTVYIIDGSTITLAANTTIQNLKIANDNATAILDLANHTLSINGTLNLGTETENAPYGTYSDMQGMLRLRSDLPVASVSIGTFDLGNNGDNYLYLENIACEVTGTYWANGPANRHSVLTGNAASTFVHPHPDTQYGNGSVVEYQGEMGVGEYGSIIYQVTTSGTPAPGATVTISITATGGTFSQLYYKATRTGTEAYTLDSNTIANYGARTELTFSETASASLILKFPPSIAVGNGIIFSIYSENDELTLLKLAVSYTQTSDTTTWTGAADTDWTNAGNWDNGVPWDGAKVVISDTSNDPEISTSTNTLDSLTIQNGANLTVSTGGTLNATTISNSGTITLDGGSIGGTPAITLNSGTIDSTGHDITLGSITVLDSGTIKADNINLNNGISSSGALAFVGQVNPASAIEIAATSTLSFTGAVVASDDITLTAGTRIDFSSNLTATGHTITVDSPVLNSTIASGDVTITANTLTLNQNLDLQSTNSPSITLAVSSLTGSAYYFTNEANLTLASGISVEGDFINDSTGSLTCAGDATFKSDLDLTAGSFTHSTGIITLSAANKSPATLSGARTFQNLTLSGAANVSNNISVSGELALTGTGAVSFSGTTNTIGTFTATGLGGKTISFGTGTTQNVTTFNASGTNTQTLKLTGTGTWNLNAGSATVQYVEVKNSNSTNIITAADSTDSGGNTNWNFPGVEYTWTGNTSTDWNVASNWSPSSIPGSGAIVTIPSGKTAKLVANVDLRAPSSDNSSIEINGTLDLSSFDLAAGTITNKGTVQLAGASGQTVTGVTSGSDTSIVEYNDTNIAFTAFAWDEDSGTAGVQYKNLKISKPVTSTTQLAVTRATTLKAGTGTVSLTNNSNAFGYLILGEDSISAGAVTLDAGSQITIADNANAVSLSVGCPVSLQKVTTTGEQTYSGDISSTDVITLQASKININCTRAESLGAQTYKSPVELGAAATTYFSSTRGSIIFESTVEGNSLMIGQSVSTTFFYTVTLTELADTVASGDISINAGGTIIDDVNFYTDGTVTLKGADSAPLIFTGSLTHETNNTVIDGTINAKSVTVGPLTASGKVTTDGAQSYNGAVTLNGELTLKSNAASAGGITFDTAAAIDGRQNLIITTNNGTNGTVFNADLGAGTELASLKVTGPLTINCEQVKTSGNQTYNDAVTVSHNVKLTAAATKLIQFVSTITGNAGTETLTTETGNSEFNGAVTNLASLTTDATATFNADITAGTLQTQIAAINCAQITTTTQEYQKAVTLGTTPSTTHTLSGTQITFGTDATIDGGAALTLSGTTDNILNANIGGTAQPTSFTVTGPVHINCAQIKTTTTQEYQKAVTLGTSPANTHVLSGTQITFQSDATIDGGAALTLSGTTDNILNANVGAGTALTSLSVTGPLKINCAQIKTSENQTYSAAVTLGTASAHTLSGAQISFGNNATIDGGAALTLSGSSRNTLSANVGESTSLTSLTVTGPARINCAQINTTTTQEYQKAVTLGTTPANTHTLSGTQITFGTIATINGGAALTLSGSTDNILNADVGAGTPLRSLSVTGPLKINCTQIKTSLGQTYSDTVNIQKNASLISGSQIAFKTSITDGAVDGSRKKLTVNTPVLKSIAAALNSSSVILGEIEFSQDTSIQTDNTTAISFAVPGISGTGKTVMVHSSVKELSFTGDVEFNPSLTTEAVSFKASSGQMTFNANVAFADNTLDANDGKIILTAQNIAADGYATLSGSSTFNDLTLTGRGKTFKIAAGSRQKVGGQLTLTGDSNAELILRSTSDGSDWEIQCTGANSHTIEYID